MATPNNSMFHHQPQSSSISTSSTFEHYPRCPNIEFKRLPFYELKEELVKPSIIGPYGSGRRHKQSLMFFLTSQQLNEIEYSKVIRLGGRRDHNIQVQLRLCNYDVSKVQDDFFPPGIGLTINGTIDPLPRQIYSRSFDIIRPPKPIDLTPFCQLNNSLTISWVYEDTSEDSYARYVFCVNIVRKVTTTKLLDELKVKGAICPDTVAQFIKLKLREYTEIDPDTEAITTVSLMCPWGKMRMKIPCRDITCTHIQCFDAKSYLQVNEQKPTWNCPVCNKSIEFENLTIDGYFYNILQSDCLPLNHSEIHLFKDGTWYPWDIRKNSCRVDSTVKAEKLAASAVYFGIPEIVAVEGVNKKTAPKKNAVLIDITLSDPDDDHSPDDVEKISAFNISIKYLIKSGWRGIVFMKSLATNQSYMWPYSISLDCTSPPSTPPQSIPPQSLMSTPPQRKSTPPFAGTPPPFAGSPNPAPGPSARCPSPSPYGFDDDTQ